MKIAIKGHITRGKEVIQILKSLGGINMANLTGFGTFKYYIDSSNKIDIATHFTSDWKIYSLEEFEKEFPFKIGDEVIFPVKVGWLSGKITGLTYMENQLKYEVDTRIGGYRYIVQL